MHLPPHIASLVLIGLCSPAQAPASDPEPVRRALLIGINAYSSPDIPRLHGCVNDIEAMRLVLTGRFGFAAGNIRELTDAAATRAGILAALEKLVSEAHPRDLVFIHYAGHGSQVEDQNGDEADRKDETLVPYDARTAGVPDVTDDELNALLGRMRAEHAIVVLDCCHSGTGTRAVTVRARQVEEDKRVELYRDKLAGTRAIVPLASERYVLLTGAADHESALDGPIEGRYHGAFSYALTRALGSAAADAAPRVLFQSIEAEMRRLGEQWMINSMPEPQLEAPLASLDGPLLPPRAPSAGAVQAPTPRLAWSEVRVDEGTKRASLDARALDVVPGASWAIYPPGESAFEPEAALALGTVDGLQDGRALLSIEPAGAKVVNGSRAVLAAPPPAPDQVPVELGGASEERLSALASELQAALPGFMRVPPGEFALLHVELGSSACRVFGSDGTTAVAEIPFAAGDPLSGKLVALIERCLDTAALLALDNPSSQMQVELRIGPAQSSRGVAVGTRGFKVVADNSAPRFRIRQGARNTTNSLQVSVRSDTDGYVTLVDIDAQGGMNLLFPNDSARKDYFPEGRIRAGEWFSIPDSLEEPNQAGFWFDAAPPAGLDTIRVFVSSDAAFAEELRGAIRELDQDAVRLGERGLRRELHATRRARLALLGQAFTTRGFKVVGEASPSKPVDPSAQAVPATTNTPVPAEPVQPDWTARTVTVRIDP